MNKITNQFASIEQVTDRYLNRKSTETAAQENSVSFEDILRQKQTTAESQELRFRARRWSQPWIRVSQRVIFLQILTVP